MAGFGAVIDLVATGLGSAAHQRYQRFADADAWVLARVADFAMCRHSG